MPVQAHISPGYRWRLGIIGLACLGFSAYCFYDGYIHYPYLRQIGLERDALIEKYPVENELREAEWNKIATEKGYPLEMPTEATKRQMDIYTQYIMLAITLPIGLIFTIGFIRAGGRWVEMSDSGFKTSWGQSTTFDAIKQINKERWDTKGIAIVKYVEDGGIERALVLDDWKFNREATTQMVDEITKRLTPEQVIGGKAQVETDTQPEAAPKADA